MDPVDRYSNQSELQGIVFTPELIKVMKEHVNQMAPEEACGLIAGRGGSALLVIPVQNILHSPVRFRMDPQEQLDALTLIDASGLELQAIYHSHPGGPEIPSFTDINEAYYPEAYSIILSKHLDEWKIRCFSIQFGQVKEQNLIIEPGVQ